jgi:hypothetical protein
VIKFLNKEGQRVTRKVEDDELADTLKFQWLVGERNSTSPAAEKKQKQRLIMSQEKRTSRGKRKDFLRMQHVAPKLRKNVLNARRLIVTVRQQNNRLKHLTKVLNTRRLCLTGIIDNYRLKQRSKLLNTRRLNGTVREENVKRCNINPKIITEVVMEMT